MADKYDEKQMAKVVRVTKMPPDTMLSATKGATVYRGVVTAVDVAGVHIIIMAKTKPQLQIAFNKITGGASYDLALVHDAVIASAKCVTLDDEL